MRNRGTKIKKAGTKNKSAKKGTVFLYTLKTKVCFK